MHDTMVIFAQAIGEYGGAGGGIIGAIERLVTTVTETVRSSVADHPAFWIIGVCIAGWLLLRRR